MRHVSHWSKPKSDYVFTAEMAEAVCQFVESGINENVIWRDGNYYRDVLVSCELPESNTIFNLDGFKNTFKDIVKNTFVITGGMGGIGYSLACHLTTNSNCTLYLIGRRPKDSVIEYKLQKLQQLGATVHYLTADVTSLSEMRQAFQSMTDEKSPICGIFHCAGSFHNESISCLDLDKVHDIYAPKVAGSVNLLKVAKQYQAQFVYLFSSISAYCGDFGSAYYGVANRFQQCLVDTTADNLNDQLRVISIAWPLWANGGMRVGDETTQHHYLTDTGQVPLPENIGWNLVWRVLSSDINSLVVTYGEKEQIESSLLKDFLVSKKSLSPESKHPINPTNRETVEFKIAPQELESSAVRNGRLTI